MKALTIQQPFATLIMCGLKTWEYRTWATAYRGSLAIHAAASAPLLPELLKKHYDFFNYHKLTELANHFPRGVLLGSVKLVDCIPPLWWSHQLDPISSHCVSARTHWAWQLDEPEWLETPRAYKGALSLWDAPTELFMSFTIDPRP